MRENFEYCTFCNSGWQIALGKESYCGWCGKPVRGFVVKPEKNIEELLIYADDDEPQVINFEITNTGFIDITIDEISLR